MDAKSAEHYPDAVDFGTFISVSEGDPHPLFLNSRSMLVHVRQTKHEKKRSHDTVR